MTWQIDFIKEDDFVKHVRETIFQYGKKLQPYDLEKFNSNIIDPVKVIFDKNVYGTSWEDTVANEIFRQRDKAANNEIGYFHQRIFQYMEFCRVPDNGAEGGWDVIYENPDGILMPDGSTVHRIYVEMKNKHNTMNSASGGKTYIKMQNQILNDDDAACFLVEAIAKQSQNKKWELTVDGKKVGHRFIRRVSIDKFYALVTGDANAFYKICMELPLVIKKLVKADNLGVTSQDSVYDELKLLAASSNNKDVDFSMAMAFYLLGFSQYNGFSSIVDDAMRKKLLVKEDGSHYAKKILK